MIGLESDAGVFHALHTVWCSRLQEALNAGLLPPDYYSLVEQHARSEGDEVSRWVTDLLTLLAGPAPDGLTPLPPAQGGVRQRATLEPDYRAQRRSLAIRH